MWSRYILAAIALPLLLTLSSVVASAVPSRSLYRRAHIYTTCTVQQGQDIATNLVNVSRWSFWALKVAAMHTIDSADPWRSGIFIDFFGDYSYATRVEVRRRFWWLLVEADRSPGGRWWEADLDNPHGHVQISCDNNSIICRGTNAGKHSVVWTMPNLVILVRFSYLPAT